MRVIKEDKKKNKTKWVSLNAEKRKNLWRSLDFKILFVGTNLESEIETWEKTAAVWSQVIDYLDCDHNSCSCSITLANYKQTVVELIWLLRVLKPKPITPYLHVLLNHVEGMLTKYSSIKRFNTSAQELKNYLQTMQQFRGSNQHNTPAALTSHQLISIWFADQMSTTTSCKRQNFKKICLDPILPSLSPILPEIEIVSNSLPDSDTLC